MVVSLHAMLGFNLKEVKKHWGVGNSPLGRILQSTVISEESIDSTSIGAIYHLMFLCLEKLLCDLPFVLIICFAV